MNFRYRFMKNRILLISFLLLNSINLLAQNITIKGKIVGEKKPASVRLMTYNDMLTCEQTTICETKSNDKGDFVIKANISEIVMAQIAVNLDRVDILLKPNSNYDVEITIPNQENVSYFERHKPVLKLIKSDDDDLCYQYNMSNLVIDDFIYDNFNRLYRNRQISLLDTLDVRLKKVLGNVKSDYVKENIRYGKASVAMIVENANKVKNQYFSKQEILYSQPAYMNLFQEMFADYLNSRQFAPSELRRLLYADYDTFMAYLKEKDDFLSENQNLAQLIVALNLKRMYYEMPDDKNRIYAYLNSISQTTKNQKNKEVVDSIIKQIDRLSFGTAAPTFSLKDESGNMVQLSDFKNNMVLLQFVNQISPMVDYQFEILKELSLQWRDTVEVVTIATRECFDDYRRMFAEKGYNWTLLNLGDDFLLLEDYQIKTYPDYVILSKNGNIGMAPAPAPEHYLDYHVRRIYNYYKK